MKFEEALSAMREGKKVKIKSDEFNFSMISKLYYDSDINRPVHTFSELQILSEDWEILE